MASRPVDIKLIKKIAKSTKKDRVNRCYSSRPFNITNTYEAGLIQSPQFAAYDQVVVEESLNESIEYVGFNRQGSQLAVSIFISSLYPDPLTLENESKWRLATVKLSYSDVDKSLTYSYESSQLIDYDAKRSASKSYDSTNFYRIGLVSLEIICPNSLARILFNGPMRCRSDATGEEMNPISARLSVSVHPTCDKFDYTYRFSPSYLSKIIHECKPSGKRDVVRLMDLVLEDRIDQAVMLQGQLEFLGKQTDSCIDCFVLWGTKSKRFIDPRAELKRPGDDARLYSEPTESLVLWVECGHVIEMCRPVGNPNLIYGWVHNNFDYAGYFVDMKLLKRGSQQQQQASGADHPASDTLTEVPFDQLKSFDELAGLNNYEIHLVSYKTKVYKIKFGPSENKTHPRQLAAIVNDFPGWASIRHVDVRTQVSQAQCNLWSLKIGDPKLAKHLADEALLGGKGNSLMDLDGMTDRLQQRLASNSVHISVPRGLVVSCVAYQLWFESSPLISASVNELDNTRRALLARSIYTNPLDEKHLGLKQAQKIMRDQCQKTSMILKSCPLPAALRRHLRTELLSIFSPEELTANATNKKVFAVRSSAVGEDSLETSAAGQMRTILDVLGFESICSAVVESWSSQFELEAVTYKSQNGLCLNLPMAVVIQELIHCETAGVAATCDPLNGNKNELQILANRGMGEGVVSGDKTDTIRVSLRTLDWNPSLELHEGLLDMKRAREDIKKQSDCGDCCLNDEQIICLSNLLLALRQLSEIKDREIEWGITSLADGSFSRSSSSSSSSDEGDCKYTIHLLQSRPLTHLHKLNSFEIDHELDYGFSSPMDLVSRANLGEVMPGTLCPINSTYFHPIVASFGSLKPYESHHTKCPFVCETFAFHGQMVTMVFTYNDSVTRFQSEGPDQEFKRAMIDSMIGTSSKSRGSDDPKRQKMRRERLNPNTNKRVSTNLALIMALDSKAADIITNYRNKRAAKIPLQTDMRTIEEYLEQLETPAKTATSELGFGSKQTLVSPNELKLECMVERDIVKLSGRLFKDTTVLCQAWQCHIRATLLSMALNAICMKMLSEQPAYPTNQLNSTEVLNDFSILMRGAGNDAATEEKTESGDMSELLRNITLSLHEEGELEAAQSMDYKQLYAFLMSSSCKSANLFRDFLDKNGHRAYKEFDFATLTWSDDPSYLMRSLALRIKQTKVEDFQKNLQQATTRAVEQAKQYETVLAKVEKSKYILSSIALPRARNAVVRREQSKSFLVKMIHKYRRAFRHLGALLCLIGKLPSAELVFWFSLEELDTVVKTSQRGDLSRLIYKARRRQQRSLVYRQVTFPTPTMEFGDMIELMRPIAIPNANGRLAGVGLQNGSSDDQGRESSPTAEGGHAIQVSGMTSCSGCVTGRACVVNSIEDMDQIEPNDILFTYSIDASWTVYFFALAGIVTEVGGIVSHGAVVAREYGIPTLCTAVGACSKFKTGQMVTLDATQGICYLVEEERTSDGLQNQTAAEEN